MKRYLTITLIMYGVSAFGQSETDSIPAKKSTDSWLAAPYNGTIITAMQNPAFAGYNRLFQIGYNYEGQNLYQAIPEPDSKGLAFWNQNAFVDFAVGKTNKNLGLNLTYNGGLHYIFEYHQLNLAQSYLIRLKKHKLTLGVGVRFVHIINSTFGLHPSDFGDPYFSFIYLPTNYGRNTNSFNYSLGLIYEWKRLFFSYSFRYEHRSFSNIGSDDEHPFHHLHASYSIDFGRAMQFMVGLTADHDNFDFNFDPMLTLMYANSIFITLSIPDLKQMKSELGLQLFKRIRVTFSVSGYLNDYQFEQNGLASISGGIRYQFKHFNNKSK